MKRRRTNEKKLQRPRRVRRAAKTSSSRASHLRRWYGITEDQYNEILSNQRNSCAVCFRPASEFRTRLAVDHNHRTGEIRGLLCTHCNRYVIGRHVDPDLLARAAEYLRNGTGWFVPENRPKRRRKKKK